MIYDRKKGFIGMFKYTLVVKYVQTNLSKSLHTKKEGVRCLLGELVHME